MIGILFKRLGPYHHARLAAVHELTAVTAFEIVREDLTYDWRVDSAPRPYPVVQLFQDESMLRRGATSKRVYDVLNAARPDVVCIPGWASISALSALSWCLLNNVPTVLMSDSAEMDAPRVKWREILKSMIVRRYAAAVVAGTPHAAYARLLGLPADLIFIGYDTVDNHYFASEVDRIRVDADAHRRRLGLPEKYFLASGRFVAKKNIPGLLKAYSAYLRLNPPAPWSLVVLGSGELSGEIEKKVVDYGLESRVILPGFRQYEQLPDYYALASALVHASTSEQWGLVVNEAMASGLPVVVSSCCGCAQDLVRDNVNGFTFAAEDTTALARIMLKMSDGSLNLSDMGKASRDIVSAWSPDRFAESIVAAAAAAEARTHYRAVEVAFSHILRAIIFARELRYGGVTPSPIYG